MSDLDRLIDAVEEGDVTWGNIAAMSYDCGPQIQPWRRTVGEAYHGSLDAAKALHDALLPGWNFTLQNEGFCYVHSERGEFSGRAETPARAWLLAILRTYRDTQEHNHG